ncbi:hypothetical protein [Arhodomonas sp. AD133]|uniref:hypothetical protein n=1 Tax=Arhodomonas sp. AD133 TaxID=3415009 RepID=UPI003EB75E8B
MHAKYLAISLIAGLGVAGSVAAAGPSTFETLRMGAEKSELAYRYATDDVAGERMMTRAPQGIYGSLVQGLDQGEAVTAGVIDRGSTVRATARPAEAEFARMQLRTSNPSFERAVNGLKFSEAHTRF